MNSSEILAYYTFKVESAIILIFLNTLLLILIRKYSSAFIGNYKYLLAVFACNDIHLCMLHVIFNPEITSFFYACFTVPFAIMNVHFLYRFWSVVHPSLLALFSRRWFVCLICLYPMAQGIGWFIMAIIISTDTDDYTLADVQVEFYKTHTERIEYGWMVMDHWRDGQLNVTVFIIIIICMCIMLGSLFLASTLGTLTYREIVKATTLSNKHRTTQYTLLIAVGAQTFIPLICVYIPYFFIIMCPFLSIPGMGLFLANHFALLMSVFPGWDALVIILLIRDYRIGLAKMLGVWNEPPTILLQHTQFTTSVQTSVAIAPKNHGSANFLFKLLTSSKP